MKSPFYEIKRAALVFALSTMALFSAGCNRASEPDGTPNPEFSAFIKTSIMVVLINGPASTSVLNSGSNSMTLAFGPRRIPLNDQDREDFASKLYLGKAVDASAATKGAKTEMSFPADQAIVVWHVSNDANPGVLRVSKYEGSLARGCQITSTEYFELSESANKFARDWLAAHPQ